MTEPSSRFWEVFFEVFEYLPRQGPGDRESAEHALTLCSELPDIPDILDLGCGSGAQTLILADLCNGNITAVDAHEPFVTLVRANAEARGLGGRVTALIGDMTQLSFPAKSFDLIWSEGALYNIGIPRALEICYPMLRSGGYLAFTDAVWKKDAPPAQVQSLFADYPTMGSVADVTQAIANSPFELLANFPIPDKAWWENFYSPMIDRIAELRATHKDSEAVAALDLMQAETDLHREFSDYYGYEFFICRKNPD